MAVKKYSLKKDGNKYISKNFQVKEFKCGDGTDTIYIDTKTVAYLQKARDHFNHPVYITSGYRTKSYNKKVGGVSNSYHIKGKAVDHYLNGIGVKTLAKFYESLGCKGIGCYTKQNFVHIDSRTIKYYWTNAGTEKKVNTFDDKKIVNVSNYPVLKKGSQGSYTKKLQKQLNKKISAKLDADGFFGVGTEKAVKKFQKKNKLTVDGIVGKKTWDKLFN